MVRLRPSRKSTFGSQPRSFVPSEFAHHFGAIDDADTFHRSKVDCGSVVDFLSRENRTLNNVINVGPVADLRSVAPNFEGILSKKSARDHGDDGMILHAARAIHREVAAGSGAHAMFLGVSL